MVDYSREEALFLCWFMFVCASVSRPSGQTVNFNPVWSVLTESVDRFEILRHKNKRRCGFEINIKSMNRFSFFRQKVFLLVYNVRIEISLANKI